MWCTFIGYNSGEYYRINQKFGSTLKGDHRHCSKYFKFLLWRLHSEKEFFNINLRQIFWVSFVAFVKEVFFFFWEKSPIEFLSSFSKIFIQFDFQNVFVQMIFLLNLLPPLAIGNCDKVLGLPGGGCCTVFKWAKTRPPFDTFRSFQ